MNTFHITPAPHELVGAVAKVWGLPAPGPKNLFSDRTFIDLLETCQGIYGLDQKRNKLAMPVSTALRACGLPCHLAPDGIHISVPPHIAAGRLHKAFLATHSKRIHLCPLNLAGEIPFLEFGPNRIKKFSAAELAAIFDLKGTNAKRSLDADNFSQFTWLAVPEEAILERDAKGRVFPDFDFDPVAYGKIEPHSQRFPRAVQTALLMVLVAPWEDWVQSNSHWHPFQIPWVYTRDDDIFVTSPAPRSPDTLAWESHCYYDEKGEMEAEIEQPLSYRLAESIAEAPDWINNEAWLDLLKAIKSVLFETPISHFLLRGFSEEGMDSFLAHLTVIEAAVGRKPAALGKLKLLGKNPNSTGWVAKCLSGLHGDPEDGETFRTLFDQRSSYVHGRKMDPISTSDQILARRLARKTVVALIKAVSEIPDIKCRDSYLEELFRKGLDLS